MIKIMIICYSCDQEHLCPSGASWVYAKKNLFSGIPVEVQAVLLFHL